MGQLGQRTGIADLDLLGILGRGTQGHGNVIGHLVAGHRNHRGIADRALGEDGDIGGTTADIHQADAQLHLVIGQYSGGRGQLLENGAVQVDAAATDAFLDVLRRIGGTGHHMHPCLQTDTGHAQWLAHAFLLVDDVVLRQRMQDALVCRDRHCLRRIQHSLHILAADFAIVDGHAAIRVLAANMAAGQPYIG